MNSQPWSWTTICTAIQYYYILCVPKIPNALGNRYLSASDGIMTFENVVTYT